MKPQEFDTFLQSIIDDQRLSDGEKKVFKKILAAENPDANRLALYRHKAFDAVRHALIGGEALRLLDWLEEVNKLLQNEPAGTAATSATKAYFSPGSNCPGAISRLIRQAQKKIDICVFTITDDRITATILAAHKKGTPIRIITDNDKSKDLGSDIAQLAGAGIPIRVDRTEYHMHHKFALFDDEQVLTGSYNWTRGAAENNLEDFIVSSEDEIVRAFAREFQRLWKKMKPFAGTV